MPATAYAAIPTSMPPDDDTRDGSSRGSTPATLSPMGFLSLGEPTFTPLSMDDELFHEGDDDHDTGSDAKPKHSNFVCTAHQTPTAGVAPESVSQSRMVLDRGGAGVGAGATVAKSESRLGCTPLKLPNHEPSSPSNDTLSKSPPSRGKNVSIVDADGGETFHDDASAANNVIARNATTEISAEPMLPTRSQLHPQQHDRSLISPTALQPGTTPFSSEAPLQPVRGRDNTDRQNSRLALASAPANPPTSSSMPTSPTPTGEPGLSTSSFHLANASDIGRNISNASSSSSLISQLRESLHQRHLFEQQQQQQQQQQSSQLSQHQQLLGTAATNTTTTIHRPQPIVRTTSDSSALTVVHPVPDLNTRSGAYAGNIAVLEKTAERLSMTSSIEDAIRDLHSELKRSDSRRSSILAASCNASSFSPDDGAQSSFTPPLPRHLSAAASILEVNNAARHGGYSPSGYVMSPNHSLTSRLRSASKASSSGRPELDADNLLSRHGPGKGSVRSVRSSKLSLAEIAESEPLALTQEVLDEADRTPLAEEDDVTIRQPHPQKLSLDLVESSNDDFKGLFGHGEEQNTNSQLAEGQDGTLASPQHGELRSGSPGSMRTFDQDHQNAFGDFDGVHCEPDYEDLHDLPEPDFPPPQPRASMAPRPAMPRPKSYFDEDLGQQMLYYPARVPMMLNLPQKLSKKPKAAVRNARHSRVLEAMGAGMSQQPPPPPPTSWLPDPLEGHGQSPFSPHSSEERSSDAVPSLRGSFHESQIPSGQSESLVPDFQFESIPAPPPPPRQRSPHHLEQSNRKSRMSTTLENIPPQLRASAFFDQPSTTPQIEIKGGSAMATLDSILDASANAPVSAFTDHAFAGKLGDEVYGREKKSRKSTLAVPRPSSSSGEQKKRGSLFPFGKRDSDVSEDRRNTISGGASSFDPATNGSEENRVDGDAALAPGSDELEESDDEDEVGYNGPPTTLLAELQLRKQQQKQRTRPINRAYPNGLHSTLLELDAVAEAQRKNRKGKRINLAWEDAAANPDGGSSEDEDVPLGVLYAAKAAGNNDMTAAVAEVNRPLGLMERRDLEDNEPLSARRARLQGNELLTAANRRSMLTINGVLPSTTRLPYTMAGDGSPRIEEPEEEDEEVEGETLGERMRRLRAKEEAENPLSRIRPVSGAFSAELLKEFGGVDENDAKAKDNAKANGPSPPQEEEETLGQRRRRLQAEREAREREMGAGGIPARRLSMADMLGAHPLKDGVGFQDERKRLEEERRVRQQEEKMAAMRAQMPTSITTPNLNRAGGFRGGAYNDGIGGGVASPGMFANQGMPSPSFGAPQGPVGWDNRAGMAFSGYGLPQPAPYGGGLIHSQSMNSLRAHMNPALNGGFAGYNTGMASFGHPTPTAMPMQMGIPMQSNMPMGMPMQVPPGQMDRVERWRQSIMP